MTESDVPTLGLGSEQRQMWTQTVMTLAYGVRERRQALGQVAWSDEQSAERRQERTARIADPTVRAMSTDEWTEAVDRRQRRHGGERHTQSGAGWVTCWPGWRLFDDHAAVECGLKLFGDDLSVADGAFLQDADGGDVGQGLAEAEVGFGDTHSIRILQDHVQRCRHLTATTSLTDVWGSTGSGSPQRMGLP